MLTVAAVTGVVLVAGVLVGLRGGGSGHAKAGPDPAATLLEPGGDGGAQAGVPGALLPSSGHRSGATPDAAAAGHTGHGQSGDGKHAASGPAKDGSHSAASGSSAASSHSGDTSAGHASSSATHPAAQDTPAAAAATTAPASSGGSSSSGVMVFSHASHRCLTVAGGQGKDGSPLEIRDCSGSSAQKWTFASDGTIRAFGLCMDAAGASTANGTVVQLATCNGGPAQQFRLNVRQDLTSVLANKCVDVKDQQTANGTRLQLWSCAGTDNQKWSKK
ncbi:ricin-type beta-trefoil lectin domain protein [Streptomyces humi]